MARKKRRGRPKGSKNKLKFHSGTFYTGMVGPKRPVGRPKGSKGTKRSSTGLRRVTEIYVKA